MTSLQDFAAGRTNETPQSGFSLFTASRDPKAWKPISTPKPVTKPSVQKTSSIPPLTKTQLQEYAKNKNEIVFVKKEEQGLLAKVKRQAEIFKLGLKNIPESAKITGGILLQGLGKINKAIYSEDLLKKLPGGDKYLEKRNKLEPKGQEIIQKGITGKGKLDEERMKLGSREGIEGFADLISYNAPSTATSVGIGLITSLLTANPALGTALGVSSSFSQTVGDTYADAKNNKADEGTAQGVSLAAGTIISAIEAIPLGRLLTKSPAGETIKKSLIKNISRVLISTAKQSGLEGVTEGVQQVIQNAFALTYDENRNLFEGVKESISVGMFLGGASDLATEVISSDLKITDKGKTVDQVIKEVQMAVETPSESRTPQQQQIANALEITKLTPDEAIARVVGTPLENTDTGRNLIKAAIAAKANGVDIEVQTEGTKNFTPLKKTSEGDKYKSAQEKIKQFIPEAKVKESESLISSGNKSFAVDFPEAGQLDFEVTDSEIIITSASNRDSDAKPIKGKGKVTRAIRSLMALAEEEGKSIRVYAANSDGYWEHLGFSADKDLHPVLSPEQLKKIDRLNEFRTNVKSKPKEVAVPQQQLPVGEGKEKVSRLEGRMKEDLNNTSPETIEKIGSVKFNQMNNKKQIQKAAEYAVNNPDEALQVIKGEKEAPKGILDNAIYVAMQNMAKGDVNLARKLTSLKSTRFGQEIEILKEIDPDSPVKIMDEIINIREEAAQKKYGKKRKEAVKTVKEEVKKKIKVDKYNWNDFINSIEC